MPIPSVRLLSRRILSRRILSPLAVVSIVLASLVGSTTSAAGATITGLAPIEFTEGGGPVPVAPDAVITEAGSYTDGYIQFSVAGSTATEVLFLPEAEAPGTDDGQVTVIGAAVYLGLGGGAYKQIGTVDSTNDGKAGRPLRVNFSAALPNADFSGGASGSGQSVTPDGWTINRNHVQLGALAGKTQARPVTISGSGPYTVSGPGYSFQTDFNYAATNNGWKVEGQQKALTNTGNWNSSVTSYGGSAQALRLWFTTNCEGPGSVAPYCSVFGPDAWSSPFDAKAGDDLAFDWAAANGGDDYEVYGFLVDTATNAHTELMYGRGGLQSWTTSAGSIPADGNYRFRFVSGSFDKTGGLAIGASLYIDNVRVLSSDASAAVAQSVARLVHYEDTGDDPEPTRTISIETGIPGQPPTTEEVAAAVTPVDDAPTLAALSPVTVVNTMAVDTYSNTTGTAVGTDPESDPITYSIAGGTAGATTVGAGTYTHAKVGIYGSLHLNSATGAYVFVPNADAVNARLVDDGETFTLVATANGLTGQRDLSIVVSVPPSVTSAPTALSATAGDELADLSWTAPGWTGGSGVTGYRIEADAGSGWTTMVADTGSAATTYQVTGLTNGASVTFRVSALNSTGTSDPSATADATPMTVPDAPAGLAAVSGNASADLTWTAPADGGSPITGYRIEMSTDGASWTVLEGDTGTTAASWSASGLTNGVATSFRVSAINGVGTGAPSTPASTTPHTVPTAPLDPSASPTDGAVTLFWLAPLSDGGSAITGYRIETSTDGTTWTTLVADTGATTTGHTVTGLTNGVSAHYRVVALNAAGAGPASDPVSSAPRTVPGAPTITSIAAGNRNLAVTFAAPGTTGGAPILNYQYSVDGGITWVTRQPASTASPLSIQPLANGTSHPVLLRAVNAAGAGPASAMVPGTPTLGVVSLPTPGTGPTSTGGAPASSNLLVGGVPAEAVTVTVGGPGGAGLPAGTSRTTGGGLTVDVKGVDDRGATADLDSSGRVVFTPGGAAVVTGNGFLPGSTVDVWMVGGNVLLGQVTVGADGSFSASFDLPAGVALGDETLQLNGIGTDNSTRTLSLDVVVRGATEERAPRSLAFTGGDVATLLTLGMVLLTVGFGVRGLGGRRRRR